MTSALAAAQLGSDTYVFASGADDALWYQRVANGVGAGWTSLGGSVISDPAVIVENGRLHVVAMGADEAMWSRTLVGGHFSGWQSLGGRLVIWPTTVSGADGYLFSTGADDGVWYQRVVNGQWSGWQTAGGIAWSAVGASRTAGGVTVAVVGADGAVWTRRLAGGWTSLGGSFYGANPAAGTSEVYALRDDGWLMARPLP